ncbi:MAG: hypothetical protein R3E84_07945 [Pseudomonadales bacterium]
MTDKNKVIVSFDGLEKGESKTVIVGPGVDLVFKGVDFKDVQVDIVDADVVVSKADGTRLVFPGMALLMFEEELAPKIWFDDDLSSATNFSPRSGKSATCPFRISSPSAASCAAPWRKTSNSRRTRTRKKARTKLPAKPRRLR